MELREYLTEEGDSPFSVWFNDLDGQAAARDARREHEMALTRSFKDTVQARAKKDAVFRGALLREGVERLLQGDTEAGKAVLRDYINATLGFEALADASGISAKSLMRMFGPDGNPQANNLFAVIACLQQAEDVELEVRAARVRR